MPRSTLYNPTIVDCILGYIAKGHNRDDAARLSGISPDTLGTWIREKPDFAEQCRVTDCQAVEVGISALEKAVQKGNVKATAMWLQNKRPGAFAPKQQIDLGNANGEPLLTAGADLSNLSTEDLMKLIQIAEKTGATEDPQRQPS